MRKSHVPRCCTAIVQRKYYSTLHNSPPGSLASLEQLHQAVLGALVHRPLHPDGVPDCVLQSHQVGLSEDDTGSRTFGALTAGKYE